MLNAYACENGRIVSLGTADATRAVWFDMEVPAPEERAFVTRITGLSLPDKASLTEIESSSRLAVAGAVLTMSMPITARDADGAVRASVCGFVLSPEHLVTLRFSPSVVFSQFCAQPHNSSDIAPAQIFAGLLEAIVDRQADALEKLREELDRLSHQIFHHRLDGGTRARNSEIELQAVLGALGRDYDTISFLRDSQLGVARIAPFATAAVDWLPPPVKARLELRAEGRRLAQRIQHTSDRQGAVSAGFHAGADQYLAEQPDQGADHRQHRRHTPHLDCRHIRHELPRYT